MLPTLMEIRNEPGKVYGYIWVIPDKKEIISKVFTSDMDAIDWFENVFAWEMS